MEDNLTAAITKAEEATRRLADEVEHSTALSDRELLAEVVEQLYRKGHKHELAKIKL